MDLHGLRATRVARHHPDVGLTNPQGYRKSLNHRRVRLTLNWLRVDCNDEGWRLAMRATYSGARGSGFDAHGDAEAIHFSNAITSAITVACMVRLLHTRISESLDAALTARARASGERVDHLVQALLAEALEIEHHSLFQVSTSSALVEGVYQGCVNVGDLLRHGNFGLGTFDSLDGEMIVIEGECFQARSDGSVVQAPADELTPFAVVTDFTADDADQLARVSDWRDLVSQLDRLRTSDNSFIGIRITGSMRTLQLRAACRSDSGVDLVEATASQSEFEFANIKGTLVGFWSPDFSGAVSIAGYHLHFISDDRQHGGHVLNLAAEDLLLELHRVNDLHVAIPETMQFLTAELRPANAEAIRTAEESRH